ncbi:MAG: hypothetical protein ABIR37_03600 [Candidatus Saccharimonadales bacterium]
MKFVADQDMLTITLEGWEVLLGLKRKLIIPRASITNLTWQPEFVHRGSLFRVVGSGLPGILYAGYFRANGKRAYLYAKKPRGMSWTADGMVTVPDALVITTENYYYPLIVVSSTPEIGERLTDWFRST